MHRITKLTGKVYGVRDIDLYDDDEIDNINDLVEQGSCVLLIDDDDDEDALSEYDIDADEIIWADD